MFIGGILLASVLIFPTELRVANLLGRGGKYEEAISTYQKILAKNPNRYNLRKELGKIYLLNNEFEKALKEFETVSTVFSSDREVLKNLYQIYSYLGDKEKTITTLEKITKLSPEDMFYQIKLAEAYEWNNNIENAIEQYKNSKDINSLNKLIHLNLRNRKYEKSIPYLKKLLELEPENIEARKLLSRVYIEMNHKEKAADELEKALSLEPDNEQLRVRLADLYLWIQRPERAILHYEYLVLHHKWNENYFNKLITLTENYDPNKAIKYYEYRFTFFPKDYKFRERFVNFYLHLGYTDEALQQIKILIENNPKEQKYLFQLARLYRDIREPKLANDVYELLFNKGFVEEEVMEALITYYQWEKEYDKLLTLYQKLLSKKLADLNIQRDYAEILILTQNYKEAIHQYSKLIKIEPRNVNYRLRLAELYYIIQEDKKAIEIIKQGLENYGIENEEYLLYAAQLFSELNYDNEGIVCYEKLIKKDKENRFYSLDLKFKLASLYWKQNNINKMNQTLEEINKSNKNEVSIHKKIAAFYFERGLFNKAIEYSQNLLISSPSDSSAMRMLGLAYAWNNQPEESKKILSEYHKIYKNDFYT
ncbi:MAG: tetratricopeptide repeat protein, partial [Methanosarcinales archaeon]